MDPARRREIASKGGKKAHVNGTAHEWTPEEARQAGRKSGTAKRARLQPPELEHELGSANEEA